MRAPEKIDPELMDFPIQGPFVASIEPVRGKSFQHGYHLGTDIRIAKWFCVELFHRQAATIDGAMSVALKRDNRIIDVYDGRNWVRENPWHPEYRYKI